MNKTLTTNPFTARKTDLEKQMEILFPRYTKVQGHVVSLFKQTFAKNLDDIVWNILDCETRQQEKHIKYIDSETKVYLLLSIVNKTKEELAECYDCISTEADMGCFNFYNRHFSNSWPSNDIEYLIHLVVCNSQKSDFKMFNKTDTYSTTPTAPGEFIVFVIN